jgi:ribosomal-protein-alanine N-acetyltransferase
MKVRYSDRASPEGISAPLRIRSMQLEDLAQVHAIDRHSFSLPWPESAYRYELLENQSSFLKVAEADLPDGNRLIVGVAVVWMILDEAHIATIAVHPDYRAQGIAKQMMVVVLQEAIRLGAHLATLEVREHNTAAQRLYHRFGFKVVGRRTRYYIDNQEDALIMTVKGLDNAYIERRARGDGTDYNAEVE